MDYLLPVAGWVLGARQPVQSVMISSETGKTLMPVTQPRSEVFKRFGIEFPWAKRTGFRETLPFFNASGPVELLLSAKVGDNLVEVGHIKALVEFQRPAIQPHFTPIIVTALGRSGTTLCMQAIGHHPEVATTRVYPYETRMAQHFMESLRGALKFGSIAALPTQAASYLTRDFVQSAIRYHMNCIDQYYSAVAQANEQPQARYFVEKSLPLQFQGWFHDLYPKTKEIVLVRDFRDMLCSILSFNAKRGFNDFSRERFDSDLEYVRHMTGPGHLLLAWKKRQDKVLLVRYEDLVLRDEETLARLFEYLEVDTSPSVISEILTLCRQPSGRLKEHMTSSSRETSIGRWRRDLPPELISAAHEVFGDVLVEFGYEVIGDNFA
ncbi:MAG: hypothetical protein Kow0063_00020 [Anaerolineae bacterium]